MNNRLGVLRRFLLLAVALSIGVTLARAADSDPAQQSVTLLIENVRLIDGDDVTEDQVVSIVIRDNVLDLVTKDEVPIEEFTLSVDAEGGFLLGRLDVGEPPSFLILEEDPRTNFAVLLDTKEHAQFAVAEGKIVRNRLVAVAETPPAEPEEGERSAWLAYTPPPMMLPTGYRDTSKWNRWDNAYVSGIILGAVVLDRMHWLSQDTASEFQFGDLGTFDGGEIRGLRFGAIGTLNFATPWVYTVFAATNAFDKGFDENRDDDFAWFDVRLDMPFYGGTTLSIGKQKEPISMERLTSLIFLPMQERAAAIDAMLPARNTGILMSGNALNDRMSWAGGVFNNWLDNDESFGNTATQFVGRMTGIPFVSADTSNLVHLGLGMRYTNAKQGLRYFTEPEFNQSPEFVDTKELDADDAVTWDLEAAWRRGPFWLSGEYVRTDVDAAAAGNPSFSGYYISGVWALTGEMRSYNPKGGIFDRPPVAKSVYQGGRGAWELVFRYSDVDLTDGLVEGGEMDIWSLGAKWWLTPFFSVDMNYRYITLDRLGVTGNSSGLNARIVLSLE